MSELENKEQGFLNDYSSNQKLNEAVIEQMGGFESFAENAPDISNHGIDGGFGGFIYYSDTVSFAQDNREVILDALKEDAQEFGHESVPEMMANWKSLDGFSQDEIAEALYSNDESHEAHTSVYNAMAWYAGEKASYEYVNAMDELEREHSLDTTFDTVQDLINSGHDISSDKVEFLNNLDNYLDENDLSVGSVTIGDQAHDFGDIEIEITNMKHVNGEYLDDVTVQVDDKGVWVSGAEDTFSKIEDANQDFSGIKNALDNELVNDVSLSKVQEVQNVKQEVQQKDNGMELE